MCIKKKTTKKSLPNLFLLFVQQEMDNLYPCCMALLYFSCHMSIYLKNCWQWFLSIYEELESIITVSHKVHFSFIFILLFYFVWRCCVRSTWHIRFTMLILPFFIIKDKKNRTEPVSPYSGVGLGQRGRGARDLSLSHPSLLFHHIPTCFLSSPCFGPTGLNSKCLGPPLAIQMDHWAMTTTADRCFSFAFLKNVNLTLSRGYFEQLPNAFSYRSVESWNHS